MNQVLCDAPQGQEVTVVSVGCQAAMRRRLRELGLLEGSRVRCLYPSAFGDPRAYLVKGTVLALRRQDAMAILCQPHP